MAIFLDRYKSTHLVRHPSWRIYKAIRDIHAAAESPDIKEQINPGVFGLKEESEDYQVYIPYEANDELTDEIIFALTDEHYEDGQYFCIASCMNLFCDVNSRQLVEGMLLSGSLPVDIAADLGYKPAVIETYANAFYDVSVWRTLADRLAYLTRGTVGEDAKIKNMVVEHGIEYVQVKVFQMPSKLKMEKALASLFGRAYEQTMKHINSCDLDEQKNAQEWVKQSLAIFKELKNASRSEGGIRELTIALETHKAPSKGINDLD